jgi:hypothetical protein
MQTSLYQSSDVLHNEDKRFALADFDPLWKSEAVANYPVLQFSLNDVRRAGEALKGQLPWGGEKDREDALRIFSIANNWRDSHAYPMRRVRDELGGQLQSLRLRSQGITVARLKRMQSIRKKLGKKGNLTQIQDLAGCRLIVPSIEDVKKTIEYNREHSSQLWVRDYDYMLNQRRTATDAFIEYLNLNHRGRMKNSFETDALRYSFVAASSTLGQPR